MGCASSKQKRCHHCRGRGFSPALVPRSYSVHVHHPALHAGDSYHMVALTSSTLGSLKNDPSSLGQNYKRLEDTASKLLADVSNGGTTSELICNACHHVPNGSSNTGEEESEENKKEKTNGNLSDLQEKLIEAKVWSSMMNEKIPKVAPKTPIMTPPGEPETINTWELMEGLEDISPLRSPNRLRSFSFDFIRSPSHNHVLSDRPKSRFQEKGTVKPMWIQTQEIDRDLDCKITDFDPEIIRSFRRSLQELPPDHPFHIRVPDVEKDENEEDQAEKARNFADSDCKITDFDPETIRSFRRSLQELPPDHPFHIRVPDFENNENFNFSDENEETQEEKFQNLADLDYERPTFSKDKVVLYFTSLRGIRKTYEDCCYVRMILKTLGIRMDERDVSMDSGFRDELKELLGDEVKNGSGITLPRVFLGKKYIGGAEEIRKLNEDGQLEKLLESSEMVEDGSEGYECEACGDIRFVPCDTCNGSCKVYREFDGEEEEEEEEYGEEKSGAESDDGFRRCPDCNENGLIRCPVCCD